MLFVAPKIGNGVVLTTPSADGSNGQALTTDGAGQLSFTSVISGLPRGYIDGLILSNDTDTDHDISVSAGTCRDATNAQDITLSSAIVKQIDATWSVGTAAGGLDTGAVANSTWYHVWAIKRSDTGVCDALFSTSVSSPTMPTNYDYKRRIGAVLTNGSANIVQFIQYGDEFVWATVARDFADVNPGTSAVLKTMKVPTGLQVYCVMTVHYRDQTSAGNEREILFTSPDQTDSVPGPSIHSIRLRDTGSTLNMATGFVVRVRTNTSGQIRYRVDASGANTDVQGTTNGWIDPRGKNA